MRWDILTVGSGRGAAVGVVAVGVDVHAALGVGVAALDVPRDLSRARFVGLLESHGALDRGVSANDGNWCGMSVLNILASTLHRLL
jgi:hypothetical protein